MKILILMKSSPKCNPIWGTKFKIQNEIDFNVFVFVFFFFEIKQLEIQAAKFGAPNVRLLSTSLSCLDFEKKTTNLLILKSKVDHQIDFHSVLKVDLVPRCIRVISSFD